MKNIKNTRLEKAVIEKIKQGKIGIIPTDTIYGLVGRAEDKKAVEKIYRLKNRKRYKPLIILIAQLTDLKKFGVILTPDQKKLLAKYWPGPTSIIFPAVSRQFYYLHRASGGLAFRLPKPAWLRRLIRQTGPLVAPSANPEGRPPAKTIAEARKYFRDGANFYLSAGWRLDGQPSKLIRLNDDGIEILRP